MGVLAFIALLLAPGQQVEQGYRRLSPLEEPTSQSKFIL